MQGIEKTSQALPLRIAEQRVNEGPVSSEGPSKSRQGHDEQEQCAVKPKGDMGIMPEARPAFRARYLQALFQSVVLAREPNY